MEEQYTMPSDPYNNMLDSERERLDRELEDLINDGAFDIERENIF